jgi:hypothetical protein
MHADHFKEWAEEIAKRFGTAALPGYKTIA